MSDRRRVERKRVLLSARVASLRVPVRIINVSTLGALVTGLATKVGAPIELSLSRLAVDGEVIWASGRTCGIAFADAIDVNSLFRAPSMFVPTTKAQCVLTKRPGFGPAEFTEAQRALLERHGIPGLVANGG